jgi:hypothetical protein
LENPACALTLNLGVRWESQSVIATNGEVVQNISVPLQPRIGFVLST